MVPEISPVAIRQMMKRLEDERMLRLAADAVLEFMHEHPVAAHWGRADLASSDMMSLETTRTVWQARADPRRRTASIGMYTHVLDRVSLRPAHRVERSPGRRRDRRCCPPECGRGHRSPLTPMATPISQWAWHGHWDSIYALARHTFVTDGFMSLETMKSHRNSLRSLIAM
jgi:hypothetical protein